VALHVGMRATHRPTPGFADFSLAFWVVTAISATATIFNRRFHPDAGAVLSGRARAMAADQPQGA
jgi:hypothetical protein